MNPSIASAQKLFPRVMIPPTAPAAGTVNGTGLEVHQLTGGGQNYLSGRLHAKTGLDTGTPTTRQVIFTIQDSADNSAFANLLDAAGNAQTITITAVSTQSSIAIDLARARRYVRVTAVTSFTGGTSPTLFQECDLVLCGAVQDPQQAT